MVHLLACWNGLYGSSLIVAVWKMVLSSDVVHLVGKNERCFMIRSTPQRKLGIFLCTLIVMASALAFNGASAHDFLLSFSFFQAYLCVFFCILVCMGFAYFIVINKIVFLLVKKKIAVHWHRMILLVQ